MRDARQLVVSIVDLRHNRAFFLGFRDLERRRTADNDRSALFVYIVVHKADVYRVAFIRLACVKTLDVEIPSVAETGDAAEPRLDRFLGVFFTGDHELILFVPKIGRVVVIVIHYRTFRGRRLIRPVFGATAEEPVIDDSAAVHAADSFVQREIHINIVLAAGFGIRECHYSIGPCRLSVAEVGVVASNVFKLVV